MRYFLGVDIGTWESKAALTDENLCVVATAARPHAMSSPKPGWAEHDPESAWWGDLCALTRELLEKSGVSPSAIECVGCSAIAPCCLPVDRELRPLRPAILYGVDVRAAKQIAALSAECAEDETLRRCGSPITSQSPAPKILWLRENEPEMDRAFAYITGTTYLVGRLTGVLAIDRYTAASWAPMYSMERQDWEADVRRFCRRDQLAECRWTQEIVGRVTRRAAEETGLATGTPVICGTADAAAEATSVGVLRPGDLMLMYGSSLFMIHIADRFAPDRRYCASPYLFPGVSVVTAGMSTAGTLTRWFRDELSRDLLEKARETGENPYALLAREAEAIPPGAGGLLVLPYFSGERTPICDPLASGVIFGLNLTHTRGHVFAACLEGVGYGIAQHLEAFRERGLALKRVVAVGGGVKNRRWLQAVSDIAQVPQHLMREGIGACYGDAMLAALGSGRFRAPEELSAFLREAETVLPRPEFAALYRKGLRDFTELYRVTRDLMHTRGEGQD